MLSFNFGLGFLRKCVLVPLYDLMTNILMLLSILPLNMHSSIISIKHEEGQVSSFCHGSHLQCKNEQCLRNVLYGTSRVSSSYNAKLSCGKKLIIGLSLTNQLTLEQTVEKNPTSGQQQLRNSACQTNACLCTVKERRAYILCRSEFLSRLFAHYCVSNCLVKAVLLRILPLGRGIYVKFLVNNRLMTRWYDKLKQR